MRKVGALLLAAFLAEPALADMYQDGSNAAQPQATNNLGKAAGKIYAPAYGTCAWGPATDVGVCVNAAIEAAYAQGGGTVTIPAGTYGVSTPIVTTRDNISIACAAPAGAKAASDPYNVPPPAEAGGCELKWIGAANGRIMAFHGSDAAFLLGAKVESIKFNGNNGLAADGLYLRSAYGGRFNNLRFVGGFSGGRIISLDVAVGEHVVPHGSQLNSFADIGIYNTSYNSTGLYLGFYQSATGQGANASVNNFVNTHIYAGTTKGIHCRGCDNNTFYSTSVAAQAGGITIDLDIYTDNGRWFPAMGNVFWSIRGPLSASPILARGKTSYPTCVAFGYPNFSTCTWGNAFYALDGSNATAAPTIEPGAYLKYEFDYGVGVNAGGAFIASDGMRAAQTLMGGFGGLHACGQDSINYGADAGSHYCFGNGQTAQLYSNGSATVGQQDHFKVGLLGAANGALNLRWSRPLGTGVYEFGDTPIRVFGIQAPALPGSCAGQPAGTLWNDAGTVKVCP